MPHFLRKLNNNRAIHLVAIVAVCVITYLPILTHTFAYDDETFFKTWKTPKSFTNIQKFIEGDTPPNHEGNYRPLRTFIYAAEYKLWGENPVGYHAQAIVVNAVIAALVYLVAAAITKNPLTGVVTGVLFGLHPAHTEAITFTTASMDTIGIAFAFASFYLYLTAGRVGSWRFYGSLVFALMAFFMYEVTLMLPVLMLLYRWCHADNKAGLPYRQTALWYGAAGGYYALMRILLMHQPTGNRAGYHGGSFLISMILVSRFFYQYFTVLLFPFQLSVYHEVAPGINSFRLSKSAIEFLQWINLQSISSFAIVVTLAAVAYFCYRSHRVVTFSICWLFITLLPVLNILPAHSLFAERYIFFPSFGFCLILGYLLTKPVKKTSRYASVLPTIQTGATVFIVLSYILLTILRNNDWKTPSALWTEVVQRAPNSAVGWNNLGLAHESNQKIDLATSYYEKAIELEPNYAKAHTNLGRLLFEQKEYEKALLEFRQAIKADPQNEESRANLAKAQQRLYNESKKKMTPRERKESDDVDRLIARTRKLIGTGNTTEALRLTEDLIKSYPDNTTLLNDAAAIYMSKQEYKKSVEYLNRAISKEPGEPVLYVNLGSAFLAMNNIEQAKTALKTALQLNPEDKNAQRMLDTLK